MTSHSGKRRYNNGIELYLLKTDTQRIAWGSYEKEVSVRKGYQGNVFCKRPTMIENHGSWTEYGSS
jgi:hypothetical protein